MKNPLILIVFTALFTLINAPQSAAQADRFAAVKIKTTYLGNGIYMMAGSGGNMGLSTGPDGAFLIDDEFAPLSKKIKAAIGKVSKNDVRFLINTHWHGDHAGGNTNFGKGGAIIVAHNNVRKRLSKDQFMKAFNRHVPAAPAIARPIITFSDEIGFHQNGQDIHIIHVKNAHTDGDAFVYFEQANVLHMGDVFFNKMYPFIDTGSGGSIDGMIAGQERALTLVNDDTKIIPGHGPLGTKADLESNLAMLKAVRMAVLKTIAQGKTADEAVAANPLAALNDEWGGGFIKPDRMVRNTYMDLAGE